MENHLYLSLIPEALILSQLPPAEFGRYIATGSKRQIEGPAVFIEVDLSADLTAFRVEEALKRCKPHEDGSPRRSVYVAIHDVLQRMPLAALQCAYLTTPAGVSLPLPPGDWTARDDREANFLYQELGPVYPRVASRLRPRDFCDAVTDPEAFVSVPAIAFLDLKIGGLAYNPERLDVPGTLYSVSDHIRECFDSLSGKVGRPTKIVNRGLRPDLLFYLVRSGLFVGGGGEMKYFPLARRRYDRVRSSSVVALRPGDEGLLSAFYFFTPKPHLAGASRRRSNVHLCRVFMFLCPCLASSAWPWPEPCFFVFAGSQVVRARSPRSARRFTRARCSSCGASCG